MMTNMLTNEEHLLGALLILPFIWLVVYTFILIFSKKVAEKFPIIALKVVCISMIVINFITLYYLHNTGMETFHYHFGEWFRIDFYEFTIDFVYNYETSVFITTLLILVSVIIKFSESYLHRETGFHRFFLLISMFLFGFMLILLSNSVDVFFMGWELVATTSVLLISFYAHRETSVANSFWAICSYRICDIGILLASALTHVYLHTSDISLINHFDQDVHHVSLYYPMMGIAFLIIFGSLAKGGQFPMVSWVIRAMEGPTPSSALYYGALSISLGPILLIKFYPLIQHYPAAQYSLIVIGMLTAPFALMTSKARSDAKSILAYSSVLQIAFVYIELGLGFKWLAIAHLVSNAFTRIYQFLRSLNTIQDFYENPLFFRGSVLESESNIFSLLPKSLQKRLYYLAINGFGLDWILINLIINPWMGVVNWFEGAENAILKDEPMMEHPGHPDQVEMASPENSVKVNSKERSL